MNVRVECPCGQAYEFPVEPVNGRMPCSVACPACGADGTQPANQDIAAKLALAPAPVAAPPPPAPAPSGLRINRPAAQPPTAPAPTAAPAPPAPPRPSYIPTYQPPTPPPEIKTNFPMAILGGLIGAGVSMAGWYFLTMAEEREYGYAAWGVGILTGLGVRILARDASPVLAYIAAICAAVAILGGEFLVTNAFVNKVEGIFDEQMKQAQVAVKLQTDDEIRSWLKANGDNEDTNAAITSQDIDNFRKVEQPAMQKLLNEKHPPTISLQLRFQIFEHSLNLFTLLWLVFGVASAWRIAYG